MLFFVFLSPIHWSANKRAQDALADVDLPVIMRRKPNDLSQVGGEKCFSLDRMPMPMRKQNANANVVAVAVSMFGRSPRNSALKLSSMALAGGPPCRRTDQQASHRGSKFLGAYPCNSIQWLRCESLSKKNLLQFLFMQCSAVQCSAVQYPGEHFARARVVHTILMHVLCCHNWKFPVSGAVSEWIW